MTASSQKSYPNSKRKQGYQTLFKSRVRGHSDYTQN